MVAGRGCVIPQESADFDICLFDIDKRKDPKATDTV